jgi:urease accessory protein
VPADLRGVSASLEATFAISPGGVQVSASSPLELRGPFFAAADPPLFLLRNVTAGILAGDRYNVSLRSERGARVSVANTSATKVYAMPGGHAESFLSIDLAAGSYLAYTPAPVILQAGADLVQATRILVAEEATLVYSEVVVLGRLASGERCAFGRFASELSVSRAGCEGPGYLERFTLRPAWDSIDGVLGGYGVVGTVLVIGPGVQSSYAQETLDALDGCYAGASELPCGGLIVRVLADRSDAALQAVEAIRLLAVGIHRQARSPGSDRDRAAPAALVISQQTL